MSNREENHHLNPTSSDRSSFFFSNRKMPNGEQSTLTEGKSSSKKKGKSSKIFVEKKSVLNDKSQIKTPQSQTSKVKKGVAVIFNNIREIGLFLLDRMKRIFLVFSTCYSKKKKPVRRHKKSTTNPTLIPQIM
jgi:hypothetical protein